MHLPALTACTLCGESAQPWWSHGPVPRCFNRLHNSRQSALSAQAVLLRLFRCTCCGFVFNAAHDSAATIFDGGYHLDLGGSRRADLRLEVAADRVASLGRSRVLEVGCGGGAFLDRLEARGMAVSGVDPSGPTDDPRIAPRPLNPSDIDGIEVVVFRDTLAEIPRPGALLAMLRRASPEAILAIETLDFEAVAGAGAFWALAYERIGGFSEATLRTLFSKVDIGPNPETQSLWATAPLSSMRQPQGPAPPLSSTPFESAIERVVNAVSNWDVFGIWGASTRGGQLALALERAGRPVKTLIDIDPGRWGRFVPLTGHRIAAPRSIGGLGLDGVLVANPCYVDEVRQSVFSEGLSLEVVGIE